MKHLLENKEFRFNEVLFEHRNKEYGAYVLRNESDKILTKALFVGVSLLAAISVTPFVINAFKSDTIVLSDGGVEINLKDPVIPDDVILPPKVQPLQQTTAPVVKTFDNTVPTPSRTAPDTKKEEIPSDAIAGLKDNFKADPAPNTSYVPAAPTIGTGTIPTIPKVEIPKEDPSKIVEGSELSVEASYEGGINAFRDKVMNKFDTSGFEDNNGVVKTTVTFIVETNGTISGIKTDGKDASFNSEAARVIKQIKGSWKPGKNKQGQAVRSYFKFPISMKFEN
ncbi:energy transducer TonB [Chryseobacterium sp. JUb7]|uniref:energy transducer TonB n=1 Tax=Chryseobacterium sp. JUb7 TaxID=2940599 RepID=UPI00216A2C86|nr:energy transducer TonB [Chryseobacterium sp. JUb7]MCS3529679.1 protein TonB [Chryseobacterium sp. JUb7]